MHYRNTPCPPRVSVQREHCYIAAAGFLGISQRYVSAQRVHAAFVFLLVSPEAAQILFRIVLDATALPFRSATLNKTVHVVF